MRDHIDTIGATIVGLAIAAALFFSFAVKAKADDYDIYQQDYQRQMIEAQRAQAEAQAEIARQIQQQNADRIFERSWQGNRSYR